jgi:hypothetical protein
MSIRFIPLEMNVTNAAFRLNKKKPSITVTIAHLMLFLSGGGIEYAYHMAHVVHTARLISLHEIHLKASVTGILCSVDDTIGE